MNENCYLLLELEFDPPVKDQAVIDQRIEEKAKFWSTNSNHFKKGAEYKTYLEMLPEIKKIMSDPVKRKGEADSACSIVYGPIDQDLKVLGTTGEIAENVIENYANTKKISLNVIKKRVSTLEIKIIQKVDFQITYDKYYKNKPKNAETFDGMKTYLKPFNKDDFYAFLNPGTLQNMDKLPCDKLKQLAQEKKKKEFYKNDTFSSAGKKVFEACELAFKDESSKTIYDDYLAWCKRRSILDNAKEISNFADKKMSDDQGDIYIGKLTELLKDRTLAENIFISFCKIEKIEYSPDLYNPGKKEDKARKKAEEKVGKEAEEEARNKAEEKVRKEAEEKARKEAEEKARKEAENKKGKEEKKKKEKEALERKQREEEEKFRGELKKQERMRRQREEAEQKQREEERKKKENDEEKKLNSELTSLSPSEIDRIIEEQFSKLPEGFVKFIFSKKMKVDVSEKVEAYLAKDMYQISEKIEQHYFSIEYEVSSLSRKVKITSLMRISLGGANFDIKETTPPVQQILNNEATTWRWTVKPLKSGIQKLFLSIDIIIKLPQDSDRERHITMLEEEIKVKVNPKYILECNWKWILGTMITIILAIFFKG